MKVLCGELTRIGALEEAGGAFRGGQAEGVISALGEDASGRGPLEQALLQEIWLEHVLDRVLLLADRDRQGREADRAAAELGRDRVQQGAVTAVESLRVDLEHFQGPSGGRGADLAAPLHLGEVPNPLQQAVGDARGATRTGGDRLSALGI